MREAMTPTDSAGKKVAPTSIEQQLRAEAELIRKGGPIWGDDHTVPLILKGADYIAASRAREAELRKALEYTLDAINTGRSEPLFVARNLIENTLADYATPLSPNAKEGV